MRWLNAIKLDKFTLAKLFWNSVAIVVFVVYHLRFEIFDLQSNFILHVELEIKQSISDENMCRLWEGRKREREKTHTSICVGKKCISIMIVHIVVKLVWDIFSIDIWFSHSIMHCNLEWDSIWRVDLIPYSKRTVFFLPEANDAQWVWWDFDGNKHSRNGIWPEKKNVYFLREKKYLFLYIIFILYFCRSNVCSYACVY